MILQKIRDLQKSSLFIAVVIFLAVLLAFSETMDNYYVSEDIGDANWDFKYVMRELLTPAGEVGYRPLMVFVWALVNRFFPLCPEVWHIFAIYLHFINATLVYWIVRETLKDKSVALLSALLWSVLPIHSETLNWLAVVSNVVLNTTLVLTSIALYIVYRKNRKNPWTLILSLVSLFAALLTKERAASLPLLIMALEFGYTYAGRATCWKSLSKAIFASMPYYLIVCLYVGISWIVIGGLGGYGTSMHTRFGFFIVENLTYYMAFTMFTPNILINKYSLFFSLLVFIALVSMSWEKKSFSAWFAVWFLLALLPTINIGVAYFRTYWASIGYVVVLVVALVYFDFGRISGALARFSKVLKILLFFAIFAYNLTITKGLNQNWEQASTITRNLPQQVISVLPTIPDNAELFFINVPDNINGAWVYHWGFQAAIRRVYMNRSIEVHNVYPYPSQLSTETCEQMLDSVVYNEGNRQFFFICHYPSVEVSLVSYTDWKNYCNQPLPSGEGSSLPVF